jgi:hypothetical protein
VRAIVAEVDGNVIVVPSVPARVREFDAESTFPSVILIQIYIANQDEAVVPDVKIQVTVQRVHGQSTLTVFAPEDCMVTFPVELFLI